MINNIFTKLSIIIVLGCLTTGLYAQDGSAKATEKEKEGPVIRFNGQGRTIMTQTGIDGQVTETDSTTIDRLTDGEFLLDLAINATPNKTSEVQTILRLRNEFGGFFGSGQAVEVRELWARGIIAGALKYRVGDMDVAMTPYTLFSFDEDLSVNEPMAFQMQKDVIDYEQFYTGDNTRRLQGGKLDFGLDFTEVLSEMKANAFIARIRGTDFFTTPTRMVTGGQLDFATQTLNDSLGLKANFGLNLVYTFDDLQSGEARTGLRNFVYTVDFDVTAMENERMAINLMGETGVGKYSYKTAGEDEDEILYETDDSFLDIALAFKLKKQKLAFKLGYVDVGPDFYSAAAQSKRIDYTADKNFYNRLGTNRLVRPTGLFDLNKDRGIYNFRISDQLMAYDPRFNNANPYGAATPNRQGLNFGVNYGEKDETSVYIRLNAALLSEIRGQGTTEKKDFTQLRAAADFNFHKMAGWKKKLRATVGFGSESTTRGGGEFEEVDLSSTLIEFGLEAEVFKNFDLLFGLKGFAAEGSDYIPVKNEFNQVEDFPGRYVVDDAEALMGLGFKYSFKKDIYLTLQTQSFSSEIGTDNPNDFDLNQIFLLYNMKF